LEAIKGSHREERIASTAEGVRKTGARFSTNSEIERVAKNGGLNQCYREFLIRSDGVFTRQKKIRGGALVIAMRATRSCSFCLEDPYILCMMGPARPRYSGYGISDH
jgi:hypothetical protein